ncbi:EamA family transporter [Halioxenophilus sp. WMMB6]|uniref:EamA family transporter n=1 Tax=Halioxenophilus sp. WMMB6 TaxID=3073815 RepID=UPI00295E5066|nr:EamA family transporter [Halioxenophilus sp. WMMB6]
MPASLSLAVKDLLALLAVIVIWGLNFVPMKFALADFTPLQLGAGRFLLASLPFLAFAARPQLPWRWLLLYSLTQGVGQFVMLFWALNVGMSAGLASLLMQVQIFFTALLGALLLHETISQALKVGLTVAAAGLGCFIVSILSEHNPAAVSAIGFGLTLGAAAMWSGSNVVTKKIHALGSAVNPFALVVWSSLLSGCIYALLTLLLDAPTSHSQWLQASSRGWLSMLYLAWAANALGYWVWAHLLTKYPASQIAPFSLGVPVVGLLGGILILGESVSPLQWLGVVLVMSALAFVVLGSRQRANRREE